MKPLMLSGCSWAIRTARSPYSSQVFGTMYPFASKNVWQIPRPTPPEIRCPEAKASVR